MVFLSGGREAAERPDDEEVPEVEPGDPTAAQPALAAAVNWPPARTTLGLMEAVSPTEGGGGGPGGLSQFEGMSKDMNGQSGVDD